MLALLSILAITQASAPKPEVPAAPQVYFSILDSGGVSKIVTVNQIDSTSIATTDPDGRRRTEPLSSVIMLSRSAIQPPQMPRLSTTAAENTSQAPRGVLHTIDGQIIAGSMASGGSADVLAWRSPIAGILRVPLDQLRRLDCVYPPSPMNANVKFAKDTLMLKNGDVLSGFVDSIDDKISIETGTPPSKQMMTVPLSRVETVLLAQDQVSPQGTVIATRGGLVVRLKSMQIQDRVMKGEVGLGAPGEQLTIGDTEIETLVFDASRVMPLALCHFHDVVGRNGRAWAAPVEFRQLHRGGFAAELELPGPMQVDFDLPKGASRFVFHAELPHSCRTWGDPELVLSAGDGKTFKELKRIKLSGDAPIADGNLNISDAAMLRMNVEAGEGGAIQDKVSLRKALILIDSAPSNTPKSTTNQ